MSFIGAKVNVKKIREILRLKFGCLPYSNRAVGQSVRCSPSTVTDTVLRFVASNLTWPLPDEMSDAELERKLYSSKRDGVASSKVEPEWALVHRELRRKNVTLALLWTEYKTQHVDHGYEYSRFCELYSLWRGRLSLSMRQIHTFGEKCFVDFAGHTVAVGSPGNGDGFEAQIFVAVLGGSSYCYVEALRAQDLPCWISAHVNMLRFFGGAPAVVVPDNLKSGVKSPDFYDPEINPTYQEWAEHYGVAVLPARVRRPKDKAKVEVAVQVVERWVLAALRNRTFTNLTELNEAIDELMDRLNRRGFRKMPGSREQLFREHERPCLRQLPSEAYEVGIWIRERKVAFDYHVQVEERHYSVPYELAGKKVAVRLSTRTVEIFHDGLRVASHPRRYDSGGPLTVAEHMPSHHRAYADWSPERLLQWAGEIGEPVREFCKELMGRRNHPEQGFRACLGILRLAKEHGNDALVAACRKGFRLRSFSYRTIQSILKHNLQNQPEREQPGSERPVQAHENLRGSGYYRTEVA